MLGLGHPVEHGVLRSQEVQFGRHHSCAVTLVSCILAHHEFHVVDFPLDRRGAVLPGFVLERDVEAAVGSLADDVHVPVVER